MNLVYCFLIYLVHLSICSQKYCDLNANHLLCESRPDKAAKCTRFKLKGESVSKMSVLKTLNEIRSYYANGLDFYGNEPNGTKIKATNMFEIVS